MSGICIQEYTQKSFIVRGDTRSYKESLKAMGGKWNTSLTDKDSGDKFGAWLFWNDKRKEIDTWIRNGCPEISNHQDTGSGYTSGSSNQELLMKMKSMESKIDYLVKMIESMNVKQNTQVSSKYQPIKSLIPDSDDEFEDEDLPVVKPKRLLNKKN
jgi:hypothetical protein